jgi:hypothetical protein
MRLVQALRLQWRGRNPLPLGGGGCQEDNSVSEERFLMLGFSDEARLLIVCHCERDQGNIIRIISARKATKNESNHY